MKEKHILKFVIPAENGVLKKDMPVSKRQISVPGKRIITYTCASGNGFRKDTPAIFYVLVAGRNGPSSGRNCQMYGRRTRTIRGMTNATGTNGTAVGSDKKTAGSEWKQAALEYQGLQPQKINRRLTWKWNVSYTNRGRMQKAVNTVNERVYQYVFPENTCITKLIGSKGAGLSAGKAPEMAMQKAEIQRWKNALILTQTGNLC